MLRARCLALLIQVVLILPFIAAPAAAEDYSTKVYEVSAYRFELGAGGDGTVQVREDITFKYISGDFSFAFRVIPHSGFDELRDFRVDGADSFHTWYEFNLGGEYHVKWYYSVSAPATRTFVLTYTAINALTRPAPDRNGLDWQAVGGDWDVPVKDVRVSVVLPEGTTGGDVAALPNPDAMGEAGGGRATLSFAPRDLAPHENYRVQVTFPHVRDVVIPPQRIARESPFATCLSILLAATILMVLLWAARGREPRVPDVPPGSIPERPSGLTPAGAGVLIDQSYDDAEIIGTMIHLAERGHLTIRDDGTRVAFGPGKGADGPEGDLQEHERMLLETLLAAGSTDGLPTALPPKRRLLEKSVFADMTLKGYFVSDPVRVRMRFYAAGVLLFLLFIPLGLIIATSPELAAVWWGVLGGLMLAGLPVAAVGRFMPRTTRWGAEERARWVSFLNGLKARVDAAKSGPGEDVGDLIAKNIAYCTLMPGFRGTAGLVWLGGATAGWENWSYPGYCSWYYYGGAGYSPSPPAGTGGPAATVPGTGRDFSSFVSNLGTTFGTVTTAMVPPSSSGGSGGFSGGGGGGGGAGGGGGGAG